MEIIKFNNTANLYESQSDYKGRLDYPDFKRGYFDEDGVRYSIRSKVISMNDLKRGQLFKLPKRDGTFSTTFSYSTNQNRLWARYKKKKDVSIYVPYDDATGTEITLPNKNVKVLAFNVFITDWNWE